MAGKPVQDKVVAVKEIYETNDYDRFLFMKGNRPVDKAHVKTIADKMNREGNLMVDFPVIVNDHFFVIDGQHRILAAKQNGMNVYYTVVEGGTIDTVISVNTDIRNWTWLNFAQSWAARGNKHYKQFMELHDEYKYNFTILMKYCLHMSNNRTASANDANYKNSPLRQFKEGDFEIKDLELTKRLLKQYSDLVYEAGFNNREFALAAYNFMRTPGYDHKKMRKQIREYGDGLLRCYTLTDFMLELEKIEKAGAVDLSAV